VLDLSWQERASCFGEDTSLFYPEDDEITEQVERLKLMCRRCPVLQECRSHSLHWEEYGFWAGMGRYQRIEERKKLGIKKKSVRTTHLSFIRGEINAANEKEINSAE